MRKRNFLLLVSLIMIMALTGCTGSSEEKTAACIVYSNRANCALPDITSNPTVKDVAEKAAKTFGFINAICVDGNPEIVGTVTFDDIPDNVKKAGSDKIKKDAAARVEKLIDVAARCTANDTEADLLEGLRLAVRSVNSIEDADNKIIVVVDSGLSTSGLMKFQNNLINAEPTSLVEQLEAKEAIPDFTDITVKFIHLGDVATPQDEPTSQQVRKIEDIWKAVVEAGNGKCELVSSVPNEKKSDRKFLKVTEIDLPEEEAIEYTVSSDIDISSPIIISEKQVGFVGDSDEYIDSESAMDTIKPIAEYLKKNKDIEILLIGTTAGDSDNSYTRSLSEDRANAVRNTLLSLGVEDGRIKTMGMGVMDPWHISGVGTEGNLASQNRKVVMLDANSEIAMKLL